MKKSLLLLASVLFAGTMFAAGPQSVKVTFNGTDNANWNTFSHGSDTNVEDGLFNANMKIQSNSKYRADLQFKTPGTYTIDATKDVVWAIKFIGDLPGTGTSKKFEINYVGASGNAWINGINGPSGNMVTSDGGKIYYFNLGADGLNKLGGVSAADLSNIAINNIHFIFADAVVANEADAHYTVDWVASFASVADLAENADWLDDASDVVPTSPVMNVTTGAGYGDLVTAIAAATNGDEILVTEDQTVTSRMNLNKALTIKGSEPSVTIKRGSGYANGIMILSAASSCNVTFENLTLDGNRLATSSTLMEVGNNGTIVLKDVVVKDSYNTNGTGTNASVIIAKSGGKLVLNSVEFVDNRASTAIVFNGNSVTLKGNIVFTNNVGPDFYLERGLTCDFNDIAWTTPLKLSLKSGYANGAYVVGGGAWEHSKFVCVTPGYRFATNAGNGDINAVVAPIFALTAAVPYATFCVDYDAVIPEGVRAYRAESENGQKIFFTRIEENIPAGTGIILYGPAGTYTMQTASSAPAVGTNLLVGTTAETSVPTDGSVYAMNKTQSQTQETLVFAQYTGGTMPANKAYLQLSAGAPLLRFSFDGSLDEFESDNFTTSLKAVTQQAEAVVYYDLLGRRVSDMTGRKGIFVVNGKKVLVK